jgi:hypothetical protein
MRTRRTTRRPSARSDKPAMGRTHDARGPHAITSNSRGHLGPDRRAQREPTLRRADRARVECDRGPWFDAGDTSRGRAQGRTAQSGLLLNRLPLHLPGAHGIRRGDRPGGSRTRRRYSLLGPSALPGMWSRTRRWTPLGELQFSPWSLDPPSVLSGSSRRPRTPGVTELGPASSKGLRG